jgi:hypothetical protein
MRTITTSAVGSGLGGATIMSFSSVSYAAAGASGIGLGAALIHLAYKSSWRRKKVKKELSKDVT